MSNYLNKDYFIDIDKNVNNLLYFNRLTLNYKNISKEVLHEVEVHAKNNDVKCINFLGKYYHNMNDFIKAYYYWKLGLELMDAKCINNIANYYLMGVCVRKNTNKALQLYKCAAERGVFTLGFEYL